jgi:hypothetical protein
MALRGGYLESELQANFTDAWIAGYESLIAQMTNDEKTNTRSRRRSGVAPW